jgi:hypothetical protein
MHVVLDTYQMHGCVSGAWPKLLPQARRSILHRYLCLHICHGVTRATIGSACVAFVVGNWTRFSGFMLIKIMLTTFDVRLCHVEE